MTTPYPEHDKMSKVHPAARVIGEFLEWLTGPAGYDISIVDKNQIRLAVDADPERLLYRYFEIDRDKIDAEKEQMLADIRSANQVATRCPRCLQSGSHKVDCSETR